MDTHKSQFNRILLIILAILYVLTIAAFSYANLTAGPESKNWGIMLLNILILSIPLVLLYGSIYVLVTARREYSTNGQIRPRLAKIIHLAPRAASILIIVFISLFSLDVFETHASPLDVLVGLLLHNIPSIAMLALLVVAWKRPVIGFVAFLAAGVLFAMLFVRSSYAVNNLLMFVFPILLIAGLFYADWKLNLN
jgi:hypothetical protein